MSISAAHSASPRSLRSAQLNATLSPSVLQTLLLAGSIASVAAAAWLGVPSAYLRADPELAFLLRGMAAIKACIVLAAIGVVFWRLEQAVPQRTASAYMVGSWLIAGATTLVWQLSFIPLAALVFHAAEFLLLFVAWRDREAKMQRLQDAV